MLERIASWSAAALALGLACEQACDRAGCDALEHPLGDVGIMVGIAGVVASESDLVANGCQECPLSQGTIELWTSATAVTTADEAQALVDAGAPTQTVEVDERYEQTLDPGEYLVCVSNLDRVCAGVTIADAVVTVHASFPYGMPDLVVFEPGEAEPRTERIFEL
jgi:hypothetical protein